MKTIIGKRLVTLFVVMILGFGINAGLKSIYHADAKLNAQILTESGPVAKNPNEELPFGCWLINTSDRTYRVQIWDGRYFVFSGNGTFLYYENKPIYYEYICSFITVLLTSAMIFISEEKFKRKA